MGALLPVGALIVAAHFVGAWPGEDVGLVSEMATLLTFAAGAHWDCLPLAAALATAAISLLSLKPEMHPFPPRITREDVNTTPRFAVIPRIILDVQPERAFGRQPLNVVNPYRIWLMVVVLEHWFFGTHSRQALGTAAANQPHRPAGRDCVEHPDNPQSLVVQ